MRTAIICLTIIVLSSLYLYRQLAPSLEAVRDHHAQLERVFGGR